MMRRCPPSVIVVVSGPQLKFRVWTPAAACMKIGDQGDAMVLVPRLATVASNGLDMVSDVDYHVQNARSSLMLKSHVLLRSLHHRQRGSLPLDNIVLHLFHLCRLHCPSIPPQHRLCMPRYLPSLPEFPILWRQQ